MGSQRDTAGHTQFPVDGDHIQKGTLEHALPWAPEPVSRTLPGCGPANSRLSLALQLLAVLFVSCPRPCGWDETQDGLSVLNGSQ